MKSTFKTLIRQKLMSLSGYWIYKRSDLPMGIDVYEDIAKISEVKTINTIFDVGANLGQSVDHYLGHLPNATIYSFEPIKIAFDVLKKKTDGLNNVKAFNIALGASPGKSVVKFYDGRDSVLNSLNQQSMNLAEGAGQQEVEIQTIDEFVRQHNLSTIDLLKIDTEGYEMNVLKGAEEMLKSKKIKLIFAEVGFSEKLDARHTFLSHMVEYLYPLGYHLANIYGFNAYATRVGVQYGDALFIEKSLIKA